MFGDLIFNHLLESAHHVAGTHADLKAAFAGSPRKVM